MHHAEELRAHVERVGRAVLRAICRVDVGQVGQSGSRPTREEG
jgi:5'-methylthioadenosine phosphorylase